MDEKQVPALREGYEIMLEEKGNSRSIVNLVPPVVAEAFSGHIFERPELFNRDEKELYHELRLANKQPTPTDNRLRLKFWTEWDRVMHRGEAQMNLANVLAAICTRTYFYNGYLSRAEKVAWLLCPPTGYMMKAEEALEFGLEQLRDILELPHVEDLGGGKKRVDHKLAALKKVIFEMLDTRIKGAPVQKQLNITAHMSREVDAGREAVTMEKLEKELLALRKRDEKSKNVQVLPPEPESVT